MTTTYDITTDVGKVRLRTGDKDITDAAFTDEEIEIYLTVHSNSIPLASADILEAWAATYGQNASDETIGEYSYKQKIIDNMLKMAKRLRDVDASTPYFNWAEMDLASIGDPEIT